MRRRAASSCAYLVHRMERVRRVFFKSFDICTCPLFLMVQCFYILQLYDQTVKCNPFRPFFYFFWYLVFLLIMMI
ncbi:hypothetical protein BX600DRAFT_155224 [Xylariales sp. PMI_506]|nr:hypothetical protein BX600DRAFT_155224 [Xylariales sp. PMI_506]